MNRNTESRFSVAPASISMQRSKFPRNTDYKTSFNVGDVIPFYWSEVIPGSTEQIKTNKVVRMQSLITPVMDNMFLDTYYFFVPFRLLWNHWKEFMGENTESAWTPTTEYQVPQTEAPSGGWEVGTIADYLGLPVGVDNISVSSLPLRCYALIMNEWFRSEALSDPLNIPVDDTTTTGVNTGNYITDTVLGGKPFKAAKLFDYFSSALPAPQRGPDVSLPGASIDGAKILTGSPYAPNTVPLSYLPLVENFGTSGAGTYDFTDDKKWKLSAITYRTGTADPTAKIVYDLGVGSGVVDEYVNSFYKSGGSSIYYDSVNNYQYAHSTGSYDNFSVPMYPVSNVSAVAPSSAGTNTSVSSTTSFLVPNNLYTEPIEVSATTISQLRIAFQLQKFYERNARSGGRYVSVLLSHFGTVCPDYRVQRPEYLGGCRTPININAVAQTSATGTTPQANLAAYSLTTDAHGDFIHSFTEHGYIMGVMVARYNHTYQQGIARAWSRKTLHQFYFPVFANISEQPIFNKELYASGTSDDDEVFGYQEAWADYRHSPNKITGELRSAATTSLDYWHWGDDYAQLPALSDEWIREDKGNVDRSLAVQSSVSNQLFADIYVENTVTAPIPLYSIPGLIDHH